MSYCRTYNQVEAHDISDSSGVITEPVTLEEMKNFLRLEGFSTDAENISQEEPISITLAEGATSAQDNRLIDAAILTLAREGLIYTKSNVVGNRKFTHNATTGTVAFQDAGEAGGETLDITYGYSGAAGGDGAFDFDNDLIEELITSAREGIEKYTGWSLVAHTWQARVTNLSSEVELPFSNTGSITEVKDEDDNVIEEADYKVYAGEFLQFREPKKENMIVTYSVAPVVPKRLKQAIMRDVAFHYENRNDDPGKLSEQALSMASSFKRVSTWLQ